MCFIYFIGRNFRGKKILRGKSRNFRNFFFRNSIIFHNSQLFLPQQYNFSQFASFSSRNLYSKGSSQFFFIHIDWYTCKTLSNLVNFPYFNSCLGVSFYMARSDRPNFCRLFKFHPIHFSSPFIKYLEKKNFDPIRFFHPPSAPPPLLSIWVYSLPSPLRVWILAENSPQNRK